MQEALELPRRRVEERYPLYVDELAALLAIDSGSGDHDGIERAGDRVAELLTDLGMSVERPHVPGESGTSVAAVVGRWHGPRRLRVLLPGHLDTVFAPGTAAGVYALDALRAIGWDDYASVTFVCTPEEEIGSPGSRTLLATLAAEHDVALCLECAREDGSVVVGRKGVVDVLLEVSGRSAHAGVEPERGINAAVAAALLTVDLATLNGPWPDVTVNVGVLRAGERPNVVPAQASVVVDVRASTATSFDEVVAAIRAFANAPSVDGAVVEVSLRAPALPWAPCSTSLRVADAGAAVASRLGIEIGFAITGGAADANLLAAEGIAVLDGLGPVGGDDHSLSEWLDLTSVVPRVTLLAGLMVELAGS